jgi:hypothetical protein
MKNDPFSQLGALDQKLFQPPSQVREKTELNKKPESPQTHLPVKPKDGKPVSGLEENQLVVLPAKPQMSNRKNIPQGLNQA